jgi:Na+-transporting NADH:ubiquinone oxidoreductase subunit NqrB
MRADTFLLNVLVFLLSVFLCFILSVKDIVLSFLSSLLPQVIDNSSKCILRIRRCAFSEQLLLSRCSPPVISLWSAVLHVAQVVVALRVLLYSTAQHWDPERGEERRGEEWCLCHGE